MEKKKETTKAVKKTSATKSDEEKKVTTENVFDKPTKNKFYYSFSMRVILNIMLIAVLIYALVYFSIMSFSITKRQYINYTENSDIDYKIYLKDNSFYEEDYLGKGMAYVASLIDKIHINYEYKFNADKESNLYVSYVVKAKLIIASQSNSNVFFEKEYDLTEEISEDIDNTFGYSINKKDIVIDYDYYNQLANDFKSHYAVNTSSRLEVTLYVNERSKKENTYSLLNNNKATLIIPLSEQEINISFDNKNVNIEKQLISNSAIIVKNKQYAIISGILFTLVIVSIILLAQKLSLTNTGKSKYDRYVNRLLRGYDRLIINIKNKPDISGYNVIEVEKFEELIDVRDNVSQPINYYIITPHQKCEFFVINDINIYVYVIKASDFNGETLNEKDSTK